jgi:predicted lysophospholipase L1 biosynthesis ABC-type transport system permease subunit
MVRDAVDAGVRVVEAKLDHWQICGQRSGGLVGLQRGNCPSVEPLPALISPALQESAQVQVGDRFGAWVQSEPSEFVVTGVVRYWPTLYERAAGFLVTARAPLLLHLNSADKTPTVSNESVVALSDRDGATVSALEAQDGIDVTVAADVRKRIRADPMALGLRSATLLSFFVAISLSLVGFGTQFVLSARQRQGSLVVLRALGVSPRQLYGSLLLEQALLVLSGLVLGTLLGLLLLRLIVPGLPLRLGDTPPVPPFESRVGWVVIARLYIVLGTSFAIAIGVTTGVLWRARLHRALRMEQE